MLTDYSLTSRLQREDANILDSQGTRRSLAYIPPEGTGRVNRGVDYRADFYSLGVVFYEVTLPRSVLTIGCLLDFSRLVPRTL
jgi:serine/threonine protein kinase